MAETGAGALILQAPCVLDGRKTDANHPDGKDYARHPHPGAQPAHDKIGRTVEDDVGDIEQRQRRGDVSRGEAQDRDQVMVDVGVHGLRQADIGADGGAEEVQDPECCSSSLAQTQASKGGRWAYPE